MAQRVMIDIPAGVEFPTAVEIVWGLNLACKPLEGRPKVISVEGDTVDIRAVQDALAKRAPAPLGEAEPDDGSDDD